ncbi:DUF748 domain-containing protein [Fodinibius saliphilus]|uniref:DUF748 domain-containing protein n=1 Tax=Fodinibius saliphilus TaxID=1920650 RepID=UPI001487575A|nr:DUF748 domain-containing protein [Fodinibius saliphilus]
MLLGICIAIIILVGSIQIYFSFFLDTQIKQTLTNHFQESTNHRIRFTINDLDLQLLGRRINISGTTISSNKQDEKNTFYAKIEGIQIRGISFWQLLVHQKLKLKEVRINNPNISLAKAPSSNPSTTPRHIRKQFSNVKMLQQLSIPKLSITGLSLRFTTKTKNDKSSFSFRNSDIHFYKISLDSAALTSNEIIPAKNMVADFRDLQYHTANGVYKLSTHKIAFSSFDSSMDIRSLQLQPKFDKTTFPNQFDHEADRIKIKMSQIYWSGIDSHKLNSRQILRVKNILIRKPDFDIYRDKRLPFPPNNNPPLPQEIIQSIPFPTTVNRITLTDGKIRYSERMPSAQKAGYIIFADLTAIFQNLSNIKKEWRAHSPTLQVKTEVMDHAELKASFRFPMGSQQQYIFGHLSSMPIKPLNKALTPLAFVRIEDGHILGMDFNMTLDEKKAKGSMTFTYQDLKISLLNKGNKDQNFGNKIKSFLANAFKVNTHNKGENLKKAPIKFERDTNKSVFNYWWKSLLSGLKTSIGI